MMLWDIPRSYDNAADMESAIDDMPFSNARTNTSGGLRHLRTVIFERANGHRGNVKAAAVVLTDGVPTVEADRTELEARRLREEDSVEVVVIGVTSSVNASILRVISSPPQIEDQNWFITEDFNTLTGLVASIAEEACRPPATTPAPAVGRCCHHRPSHVYCINVFVWCVLSMEDSLTRYISRIGKDY